MRAPVSGPIIAHRRDVEPDASFFKATLLVSDSHGLPRPPPSGTITPQAAAWWLVDDGLVKATAPDRRPYRADPLGRFDYLAVVRAKSRFCRPVQLHFRGNFATFDKPAYFQPRPNRAQILEPLGPEAPSMDSKPMTRKDFFTLTFTLVGGAVVAAGCSSSTTTNPGTGGTGGAGTGIGGSTGTDAAADTRTDTGAQADTGISCADPLPETQQADATGHVHTLTVPASTLLATTAPVVLTSGYPPDSSGAHFHSVTFSLDNLATLKSGGSVTVPSDMAGNPVHMHTYLVSCH
jgi:hypothetical protein